MKNLQAIFFDFDGVIVESIDIKGWAFGKLFEQYPEHVDSIVKYHHANGGVSRFDKFRYIYREILKKPLDDKQFEKLCNDFSGLVYQKVLECDYVPGILGLLQQYHQSLMLFIISGTPHEEMQKIVDAKGLRPYFHGVFGSPTSKDKWVRKILVEQNLDAGKTLFVGDAMCDYNAARKNGIRFIGRVKDIKNDIFKNVDVYARIQNFLEPLDFMKAC